MINILGWYYKWKDLACFAIWKRRLWVYFGMCVRTWSGRVSCCVSWLYFESLKAQRKGQTGQRNQVVHWHLSHLSSSQTVAPTLIPLRSYLLFQIVISLELFSQIKASVIWYNLHAKRKKIIKALLWRVYSVVLFFLTACLISQVLDSFTHDRVSFTVGDLWVQTCSKCRSETINHKPKNKGTSWPVLNTKGHATGSAWTREASWEKRAC